MVGSHMLQYIFRNPVDSFNISLLNFQPNPPEWYMPEFNNTKDTLDFWLKPVLPDTIRVRFSTGDSLVDTTKFSPRKSLTERGGKRKEAAKEKLKFTSSAPAGTLDLNRQFTLYFTSPVISYVMQAVIICTDRHCCSDLLLYRFASAKSSGEL
jgi:hypothetical protein